MPHPAHRTLPPVFNPSQGKYLHETQSYYNRTHQKSPSYFQAALIHPSTSAPTTTVSAIESKLERAYNAVHSTTELKHGIYWRGHFLQRVERPDTSTSTLDEEEQRYRKHRKRKVEGLARKQKRTESLGTIGKDAARYQITRGISPTRRQRQNSNPLLQTDESAAAQIGSSVAQLARSMDTPIWSPGVVTTSDGISTPQYHSHHQYHSYPESLPPLSPTHLQNPALDDHAQLISTFGDTSYLPTLCMQGTDKKRLKSRAGGPLTQMKKLKSKAYDLKAAAYRQRNYRINIPESAPSTSDHYQKHAPSPTSAAPNVTPLTSRKPRSKSVTEELHNTEDMEKWIRKKKLNRLKQPKKLRTKDALDRLTEIDDAINPSEVDTPRAVTVTATPKEESRDFQFTDEYYDLWRKHDVSDPTTGLFIQRAAANKFPVIHNPKEVSVRETHQHIKDHRARNALRAFVLKKKNELHEHALGIESSEQLMKRNHKIMNLLDRFGFDEQHDIALAEEARRAKEAANAPPPPRPPPPELNPSKLQWQFQHDDNRFALYKLVNDSAQYHMVHVKDNHLRHHLLFSNELHGTTMALDSNEMYGEVVPKRPLQRDTAERLIRERATSIPVLDEEIVERELNCSPVVSKGQKRQRVVVEEEDEGALDSEDD